MRSERRAGPAKLRNSRCADLESNAMTDRTIDEPAALSSLSTSRLVDRVYNLPFSVVGINLGLAAHWIFSAYFGRSLFDVSALPPGAIVAGGIAVLVVTAVLPFAGLLVSVPAQGIGRALRLALGLLLGSRRSSWALARGWVPLRKARLAALAERDRYWTSRVDSALAACVRRARRAERLELQGFGLLVLLAVDASCSPALVPSLLKLVGLASCAEWLGCLYVLLALAWCWSVAGDVTAGAIIYHPVLAQQLVRERALRRSARSSQPARWARTPAVDLPASRDAPAHQPAAVTRTSGWR